MKTTESTRPSRILAGSALVILTLLSGCASTDNGAGGVFSLFKRNPYDNPEATHWWGNSTETAKAGAEGKRTEGDENARRDLDEAKRVYDAKDYAKAEPLFKIIAKSKTIRQDVHEEALFLLGECQRNQQNLREAEGHIKLYIKSYPYGKFTAQANENLFRIANYWLKGTIDEMKAGEEERDGKRWFTMPASYVHFSNDMPFTDAEGHAIVLLEEVRLNDIRGKLAEKALFYIATVKFYREDYKDADFYYSQIVDQYPKSELAAKAMKQSIICKQIANGGTAYDTRLVEKCRGYLEEFSRSYPGKDTDWIQKQLVSINQQQADRDFNIGEFYRRTGHPGSAYFYYELVRRRYPNTDYAKKADDRMNELRSRVQEEQRTMRSDGNDSATWFENLSRALSISNPAVMDTAAPATPPRTAPGLLPTELGKTKSN